jgi:hypothetical protein
MDQARVNAMIKATTRFLELENRRQNPAASFWFFFSLGLVIPECGNQVRAGYRARRLIEIAPQSLPFFGTTPSRVKD